MKPLRSLFALYSLVMIGCGDSVGDSGDGEGCNLGSSDDENESTEGSGAPPMADSTGSPTPTTGSTETADDSSGSGTTIMCYLFEQDCPDGQKCMPYTNDNGTWNAWGCFPVDDNPGEPGDPCTVTGSGTAGMDDCAVGSMCWDVDSETNTGTCVALCGGSEAEPSCDQTTECAFITDVLPLCLQTCNPVDQDCPSGEGCYLTPTTDEWFCGPVDSEKGYGDACELFNDCMPGFVCVDGGEFPMGCPHSRCCTEVCDYTAPEGDEPKCPEGQTCLPYDEGAPPWLQNVGICEVL
jgi:hypothetical protein